VFDVQLVSKGIPAPRIPIGAALVLIVMVLAPATLALSGLMAGLIVALCASILHALVRGRWSPGYGVKSTVLAGTPCGVGLAVCLFWGTGLLLWPTASLFGFMGVAVGLALGLTGLLMRSRRRPSA
jgi:hypothetical protein